tara:strand:+ start:309 stop:506 length:198 start_codon:yes stop_codon:yes gene_type:complete
MKKGKIAEVLYTYVRKNVQFTTASKHIANYRDDFSMVGVPIGKLVTIDGIPCVVDEFETDYNDSE